MVKTYNICLMCNNTFKPDEPGTHSKIIDPLRDMKVKSNPLLLCVKCHKKYRTDVEFHEKTLDKYYWSRR